MADRSENQVDSADVRSALAEVDAPKMSPKAPNRAPVLALLLYGLLALSACVALLDRGTDLLPRAVCLFAPLAFCAFLILFAIYRFTLVRARRYSAGKAFFQVGIGVLFACLLAPGALFKEPAPLEALEALLHHAEPSVRALACEASVRRDAPRRFAPALIDLLDDPHPAVRQAARQALSTLAQRDLGPDAGAWKVWLNAERPE